MILIATRCFVTTCTADRTCGITPGGFESRVHDRTDLRRHRDTHTASHLAASNAACGVR